MPQSLSQIYVHLVFSTAGREPLIVTDVQPLLHAYLAGTLNAIGSPAVVIGGTSDHVHLLFRLSRTMTVSEVVKSVKVESSKWMKENGAVPSFAWQAGYGAFSIGASQVKPVIHYIQTQEKHHAQRSFQEEYRRFLELYGVSYDEAHVWD